MDIIKKIKSYSATSSVLKILVIAIIALVLTWGIANNTDENIYNHAPFQTINSDWVQIIDGTEVPLDTAQDALILDSEPTVISCTLPDIVRTQHLVFYVAHQDVTVYVDDDILYTLDCPENMEFFGSSGRNWIDLPLTSALSGKTLTIELYSAFSLYHVIPHDFSLVSADDIQILLLESTGLRSIIAVCILLISIILYVHASIWKRRKLKRFLFSLADVYLFTGLWLCAESNSFDFIFNHPALSSLLSMIFIRVVPITFYYYIRSSVSVRPSWLRPVGILAWVNFIATLILQFVFKISLITTLPITIAVYFISCIIYLVGLAEYRWGQKITHLYDSVYYATAILLLASIGEVYCYLHQAELGQYNGFIISLGCTLYALVIHILLLKKESKTDIEKTELEIHYNELQIKPLYQQINAHFLYNTLNTISAYCKESPERADMAVNYLAKYMRKYTTLVDCDKYVSFEEELSLIQLYINILNLRYEETIVLDFDIAYSDFILPPLTLQPLIENAVAHGLHGHVTDGIITIRTRRHGDAVELVVSDNGAGEKNKKIKFTGVGLKNLSRRMNIMGGSLVVRRARSRGAEIVLHVPLKPDENI